MSYLCYLCLLAYSGLQHLLLLYVLYVCTFLVPCCDVSYDFRKNKTMFDLSLLPLGHRRLHLLFLLLNLLFFAHGRVKHFLNVWVVWRGGNCYPSWPPGFTLGFLVGSEFPFVLVLCCALLWVFVCIRHVSCVPNVASVSGLSILDYPSVFFNAYFNKCVNIFRTTFWMIRWDNSLEFIDLIV